MPFSGSEDIGKADTAASDLRSATGSIAELVAWLSTAAERVGCGEFAEASMVRANEGLGLVRSVEDLVIRKRDALILASTGMESIAQAKEREILPLLADLRRDALQTLSEEPEPLDRDELEDIVFRIRILDPSEQDARDDLLAELQTQLAMETGDFESGSVAAQLMVGGATLDEALAYVAAGDDIDARLAVFGDSIEHNPELASAILPTLDLQNKQDLLFATHLLPFYFGADPHLPYTLSPPEGAWDGVGQPTLEELEALADWVADAREAGVDMKLNINEYFFDEGFDLLNTVEAAIDLNAPAVLAELNAAYEDAISGGDVEAALEVLGQYGARNPEFGGFEVNLQRLEIVGISPAEFAEKYNALLSLQLQQYEGLPDRPSLDQLIAEAYEGTGMDPVEAQQALVDLMVNIDFLVGLDALWVEGGRGRVVGQFGVNDIAELRALLDYPNWPPEPRPDEIDLLTGDALIDYTARKQLRENALAEGVDLDRYVARALDDLAEMVESEGMNMNSFEGMIDNLWEHHDMVFGIVASTGSTAFMQADTGADFLDFPEGMYATRESINLLGLNMIARMYLSDEDINEIDTINRSYPDRVLSMDDFVEWLPGSGLPFAVQDLFLQAAHAGSVDPGSLDSLATFVDIVGVIATAVSMLALLPTGAPELMMVAGVAGRVATAADVASVLIAGFQGRFGDAAVQVLLMAFDGTRGGAVSNSRIAILQTIQSEFPDVWERLAGYFPPGRLDDLANGTIQSLPIDDIRLAVDGADSLSPDQLAELRALCSRTTVNGEPVSLSPAGVDMLMNNKGARLKSLVEDYDRLGVEASWELFQLIAVPPGEDGPMSKEEFETIYAEGLRFNPHEMVFE